MVISDQSRHTQSKVIPERSAKKLYGNYVIEGECLPHDNMTSPRYIDAQRNANDIIPLKVEFNIERNVTDEILHAYSFTLPPIAILLVFDHIKN